MLTFLEVQYVSLTNSILTYIREDTRVSMPEIPLT